MIPAGHHPNGSGFSPYTKSNAASCSFLRGSCRTSKQERIWFSHTVKLNSCSASSLWSKTVLSLHSHTLLHMFVSQVGQGYLVVRFVGFVMLQVLQEHRNNIRVELCTSVCCQLRYSCFMGNGFLIWPILCHGIIGVHNR